MPNAAAMKMAFNGGELSPLLDGRTDLAKYASGCSIMENYIPTVHGPIRRRPGTRFVADAGTLAPVLVPFVFNRTQSYVLAIASEITVYSARGVVEASPGVPYTFGADFWTGPPRRADGVSRLSYTQSGDVLFVCDAEGGLPLMAIKRLGHASWTVGPYALANPPLEDWQTGTCLLYSQLADGTTAAADEFYLAINVGKVAGQMIADGVGGWTGRATTFAPNLVTSNPFYTDRRGKIAIDFASHVAQPVRWDPGSGEPVFTAFGGTMDFQAAGWYYNYMVSSAGRVHLTQLVVGGLLASETNNEYTPDKYISNGTVVFEILEGGIADKYKLTPGTEYDIVCARVRLAAGPGNEWREPAQFKSMGNIGIAWDSLSANRASTSYKVGRWAWASVRDYPIATGDETLDHAGVVPENVALFRERLWLGSSRDIWASQAGGFDNFNNRDGAGQVVADSALDLTLLAGDLSPVSWMTPSDRLVLGSFGGERAIGEQNISDPFGPLNAKVDASGAYGALDIQPSVVGSDVLFVDRSGRRVRRSGLNLSPDDAADLSLLSEHLGAASPFVDMAYQMTPGAVLWLVQANGSLVGMTYDRVQDVAAWHRHDVGGDVLAVCSTPSPDGTRDDLWMVVEREVDGETVFYVEVLVDEFALGTPVEDQCFLDCSLSYSGAPADVISGLDHLEGESVAVLADGSVLGPFTVASGEINLGGKYSKVHVGLAYSSRLRTMRLEKQTTDGSSIGKIGRVHRVVLRLLDSVGIKIGATFDTMDRKEFRRASVPQNSPVPISTTDLGVDFPGGHNVDQYVCIEQDQPLPSTILSMGIEYGVQG